MSTRSVFFFQAEDGIRGVAVTGVQTCALPICLPLSISNNKNPACSLGNGCSTFAEIPREAEEREIQAGAESVMLGFTGGGMVGDFSIRGGDERIQRGGIAGGAAQDFRGERGPAMQPFAGTKDVVPQ